MKKFLSIVLIVSCVVGIDQVIKYFVRTKMTVGQTIPADDAFISLHYLQNDGIAFSMFQGNRWFLVTMQAILILIIIVVMALVIPKINSKLLLISFSLMLGGGIGNIIDRIVLGVVVDYVSIGSFAVFNFADAALTTGCGVMLLYLFTSQNDKEKLEENISRHKTSSKGKEELDDDIDDEFDDDIDDEYEEGIKDEFEEYSSL